MTERLLNARQETDSVFHLVNPDALYDRPIPERHRIVFYIGHLEAFDWNLLSGPLGLQAFDPEFDRLFAFGIDPVGGGLPNDTPRDWPSLERVFEYRDRVRQKLDSAEPQRAGGQLMSVALEHRLMHAETLAYMLHQLPLDRKVRIRESRKTETRALEPEYTDIPEGTVALGLTPNSGEFGWDNEFDRHTVHVPAFSIGRYKVTNGQFAEFIREGGYRHRPFWTDSDWDWITRHGVSSPVFWTTANGEWLYRTMFDEIPLPLEWPVFVSHAEASAYCRWAGMRLPSEAEWQRAAEGASPATEDAPDRWDPLPASALREGRSAFGVEGLFGNGWEWTSTPFAPFDGFQPFPFYPGYSANFFDGKHYVMKGGSMRTAPCMLRPSFRNWFQSHYQYVYAGFRCAV